MNHRRPRYKIGDAVRLASALETHLGTLPAGTAGEIQDLACDRARVRVAAGEIWVDLEQLQPELISLDESGAT